MEKFYVTIVDPRRPVLHPYSSVSVEVWAFKSIEAERKIKKLLPPWKFRIYVYKKPKSDNILVFGIAQQEQLLKDWAWKRKFKNPYAYYAITKTGVKRLVKKKKNPRWLKCPKCGAWMIQEKYFYCPSCGVVYNPIRNPEGLYEAFHDVAPVRKTKVYYEPPPSELIAIGQLRQINYQPIRGKHSKTEFFHRGGDLGDRTIKVNTILATDKQGKNLYIVKKSKGKYPMFSSRGILG